MQLTEADGHLADGQRSAIKSKSPQAVIFFAHFFSYVFHPLFVPLYVTLFLMYVHPSYFSGVDKQTKFWLPFSVAQLSVFYPLLTVILLKGDLICDI